MKIDCVIGIDAGANGGIAIYTPYTTMRVVKMPKSIEDLAELLEQYKDDYDPMIFLEKLSVQGNDFTNFGKVFRIKNMLDNFSQIKAVLALSKIPYVLVHPMKWQTTLGLRIKGEEKAERKKRYKEIAQDLYPNVKATMWNCDAMLIAHFGRKVLREEQDWVKANLPNLTKEKLF